jgi:hypothetical protein
MAITYKWVINKLSTAPREGDLLDVVKTVSWVYQGIEGDIIVYQQGNYDCVTPSDTDFTAYPDLTFDQVCGWLEAAFNMPALQENINTQIYNIINPPIVVLPLPWETPNI